MELGVKSLCPDYFPLRPSGFCVIPDGVDGTIDEYNNLFIVTTPKKFGSPTLIKAWYGEPVVE